MSVLRENKNTPTGPSCCQKAVLSYNLRTFLFLIPSTLLYNPHFCFKEGDLLMICLSLNGKDNKVTGENKN